MLDRSLEMNMLFDFYSELLTAKQKEVLQYYYQENFSLQEIANVSGTTRQGVFELLKRTEAILLDYEAKLKLLHKHFNKLAIQEQIQDYVCTLNLNHEQNQYLSEQIARLTEI